MTAAKSIAVASTADGLKFAERLGANLYRFEVVEAVTLTPSMRRVVLRADALAGFSYKPGQDAMLAVSTPEGATVRRRFTIRAHDSVARTIAVHVVTHGQGPGSRWAMSAEPGSEIEGIAPRGKITVVAAASHVFVGDETFLPAAAAMIESLAAGTSARLVALVASAEDERPIKTAASLVAPTRVHRASGGDVLAAVAAMDLTGDARAYVGGEAVLVRNVKEALVGGGFPADKIAAKAYWRADRSNAGHGEPESI